MPAPNAKSGRSQLNVWVKSETSEFIREYAKRKGFSIGEATDRLIGMIQSQMEAALKVRNSPPASFNITNEEPDQ